MEKSKQQIRKSVLEIRDALTDEERKRGEVMLTERIMGHQWYYRSTILLAFASYGSEISTREILKEALRQKKEVYLPKIIRYQENLREMVFYRIRSFDDLVPGYKGIPEPVGEALEYQYSTEIAEKTLMLMPGVAFDPYRNRLGYGKGFYDRYLHGKEALQLRTIGIGFQCQMVEQLPFEETDVRPYQVICV